MAQGTYSKSTGDTGSTMEGVLQALMDLIAVMRANAGTALPGADFTDQQRAMAMLPLPFRNIIRDPFMPDIGVDPVTTAYPQKFIDGFMLKGCSSFRIFNPNSCPIRFRGASGFDDKIQAGEGRMLGPWQTEVFSTQNPTHLSVMLVLDEEFPLPKVLRRPELNYGIGG
jgi:hypothetical protein